MKSEVKPIGCATHIMSCFYGSINVRVWADDEGRLASKLQCHCMGTSLEA